jgi:chromosome segregation ATPase
VSGPLPKNVEHVGLPTSESPRRLSLSSVAEAPKVGDTPKEDLVNELLQRVSRLREETEQLVLQNHKLQQELRQATESIAKQAEAHQKSLCKEQEANKVVSKELQQLTLQRHELLTQLRQDKESQKKSEELVELLAKDVKRLEKEHQTFLGIDVQTLNFKQLEELLLSHKKARKKIKKAMDTVSWQVCKLMSVSAKTETGRGKALCSLPYELQGSFVNSLWTQGNMRALC